MTAYQNISSLVTVSANGAPCKTGAAMSDVGEIRNGAVLFDEVIEWVGTTDALPAELIRRGLTSAAAHRNNIHCSALAMVDCTGLTVMPGFVDSHSHMVFAGTRAHEFARRLSGVPYQTIAAEGGGILSTMRATREASLESLVAHGRALIRSAREHGTTTLEIKSGYGLSLESELRILEAIGILKKEFASLPRDLRVHIHATFLGAHAFPPEYADNNEGYIRLLIDEILPAVASQGVAEFCDVFADAGYFTVEQSERVLHAAKAHGLRLKVHAEEIQHTGATQMAARMGCVSADHLEEITTADIIAMRDAGVVATLLPGTAYTLRLKPPPARTLIDSNVVVALASDCNPGSCYCENMQLVLSLACITMHMSIEEAVVAATLNGAAALGISNVTGSIEVGKRADLAVYDVRSYKDLVYRFGVNQHVWPQPCPV